MQLGRWFQQHCRRLLQYYAHGFVALLLSSSLAFPVTDPFTITVNITNFYNVITDGGATCNGVVDDSPAFAALSVAIANDPNVIAGRSVTVTVPPGSHCVLASCPGFDSSPPVPGFFAVGSYFGQIPGNFTFIATGASITGTRTTTPTVINGCLLWNGGSLNVSNGSGPADENGFNQPFASVSAGASCVTISPAADAVNYPVGNDAIAAAIGVQINGFPPNQTLFEYLTIASSNPSTGQICFTTPLVNSYSATWINLGNGNCDNTACGSNGHLMVLDKVWSHTLHYIGGTWVYYNEFRWQAKTIINENMTFNDVGPAFNECFFPTLSKTITLLNTTVNGCTMEYDKLVDTFILDGSTVNNIIAQSTSNHTIHLKNGALTALGTPQNTICENSTITPLFISTNFGAMQSFSGTNCIITSIAVGNCCNIMLLHNDGGASGNLIMSYAGSGAVTATNFNSCVGTYTSPPTAFCSNPPQFDYQPGTILTMKTSVGDGNGGYQFKITDNSFAPNTPGTPGNSSGTFTVQTTITGASLPSIASGTVEAQPDPMRNWACTNCTGSQDAIDLSQPGAQNQPLYTYSKRIYTCVNNIPNVPNSININSNLTSTTSGPIISGNFVFMKINVTQADTSGSAVTFDPVNKFGNYPIIDQATGATGAFGATIDLTRAGLRTITATGTGGAVGGDVLTPPGTGQWLGGGQTAPFTAFDLSSEAAATCPVVSVEWQADRTTLKFP